MARKIIPIGLSLGLMVALVAMSMRPTVSADGPAKPTTEPNAAGEISSTAADASGAADAETVQTAIVAGGCFWCIESAFELVPGVSNVESGYIGGLKRHADYNTILKFKKPIAGLPLHTEAVRFQFDPRQITYEEVLRKFMAIHDPTSLYRQGPDSGPQYMTAIFYVDNDQREIAEKVKRELDASGQYSRPIVTKIKDGTGKDETSTFYMAEDYHQDYFRKNPDNAYCVINAAPKMRKMKKMIDK